MTVARAIVLLLTASVFIADAASEHEDMSYQNRGKPKKGAAMFQASMSMQTLPTKTPTESATDPAENSSLQVLLELLVKVFSPAAAEITSTIHALSSFAVYSVFTFVVALIYRKRKSDSAYCCSNPDQESSGFAYGLVSFKNCLTGDKIIFLLSFCCIGVRWADTMDKSRLGSFWVALSIFTVCSGLSHYTTGFTTVALMCFVVYCRQALRQKYNMEHGTIKTCLADIAVWWFCFPLAAVQEARQVEYVQPGKVAKIQ